MKKITSFLVVLLIACNCLSQKNLLGFGQIDPVDLNLSSCPFEPDAPAMKLFDVKNAEFISGYGGSDLVTERRVRIKIFNKEGYKYASIRIPYYNKNSIYRISDLKGIVYNLDEAGNVVAQTLTKKDFFKNQSDEALGLVNFTFPGLKPGCVIEYSYVRTERENSQLDPWVLQDDIPVAYAAHSVTAARKAKIKERAFGFDSLDHVMQDLGDERNKWTYFKTNIPSFHPEPFMSSVTDNLMRVKFLFFPFGGNNANLLIAPQLVWKNISLSLLGSDFFGGQIKKKIPGTDSLLEAAKKMAPEEKRIEAIFDAVRNRFGGKAEQALFLDDIADAWKEKQGTTADVNLILLNLLQKLNVSSYPLLVSTRSNGKVSTDFPSLGQFNGLDVLAFDSSKVYILDASIKGQSYRNPPFSIINRVTLMVNNADPRWVRIEDKRTLMRQETNIDAVFNEDGCIDGVAKATHFDFAKLYALDSTRSDENTSLALREKSEGLKINFERTKENTSDAAPLEQEKSFTYTLPQNDKFYFLSPLFLITQKANPFIQSKRNSEIDMGNTGLTTFSLSLKIPSSYEVEFLPKSTTLYTPDSSIHYERVCTSDSSQISFSQTFEIKSPVLGKEAYPAIQEFFKKAYAMMAEEIILKKKK